MLDVAAVGGRVVRAGTIAAVTGQDPVEVGALLEEVPGPGRVIAAGGRTGDRTCGTTPCCARPSSTGWRTGASTSSITI